MLGEHPVWWMVEIIDLKKEKRLFEAGYQDHTGGILSGIMGFCHTALRCAEGVVVVNVVFSLNFDYQRRLRWQQ